MGFFTRYQPQTFGAWFDDVTRGFCDFAKGQVREEYEDHFTAAYEDFRAEGLGEDEAERATVQSLGDARQIRRQLRKVYLTCGEDARIGRLVTPSIELPNPNRHPILHELAKGAVLYTMRLLVVLNAYLVANTLDVDWALVFCGIAILMLVPLGKGFRIPWSTHTNSMEDLLYEHALFKLQWAILALWTFIMLGTVRPSLRRLFDPVFAEAFLVVVVASWVLGFLAGFREFLSLKAILRKLRRYPKQTATSSVLALRVLVEHSSHSQETAR